MACSLHPGFPRRHWVGSLGSNGEVEVLTVFNPRKPSQSHRQPRVSHSELRPRSVGYVEPGAGLSAIIQDRRIWSPSQSRRASSLHVKSPTVHELSFPYDLHTLPRHPSNFFLGCCTEAREEIGGRERKGKESLLRPAICFEGAPNA